tara:strand:+ start:267 stop:590 length:324 start_codon:yes stop_codon:yes gene_type:complete
MPTAGFGFACDEHGNLEPIDNPYGKENREGCLSGKFDVIDKGIEKYVNRYCEPAIGKCSCGEELALHDPLDNQCDCGKCYNSSGQLVTPSWECDEQGNPLADYYDHD